MAMSELYSSSASIGATEYSLTNDSTTIAERTTPAILTVVLDLVNMAAGDEYELVLREKATSAGTQRVTVLAGFVGAQNGCFFTAAYHVMHGWDVTLRRVAGTDRTILWSIRGVT